MSDPLIETGAGNESQLAFKDGLLQETLLAVRRRKRCRRTCKRALAGACCGLVIFGIFSMRQRLAAGVPVEVAVHEAPATVVGIERELDIVMVRSQPIAPNLLVRTDPGAVAQYVSNSPSNVAVLQKASDDELMAALDGRRVILATDLSGRSRLRLLD